MAKPTLEQRLQKCQDRKTTAEAGGATPARIEQIQQRIDRIQNKINAS